jgi:hypothetical protein
MNSRVDGVDCRSRNPGSRGRVDGVGAQNASIEAEAEASYVAGFPVPLPLPPGPPVRLDEDARSNLLVPYGR